MTGARPPLTPAERQKLRRRRDRLGLAVYSIEVDEFATVQWLLEAGRIDPDAALEARLVEAALAAAVGDMIRGK